MLSVLVHVEVVDVRIKYCELLHVRHRLNRLNVFCIQEFYRALKRSFPKHIHKE